MLLNRKKLNVTHSSPRNESSTSPRATGGTAGFGQDTEAGVKLSPGHSLLEAST